LKQRKEEAGESAPTQKTPRRKEGYGLREKGPFAGEIADWICG